MEISIDHLTDCWDPGTVLVVGVGNPLRGDDAAGLHLAEGVAEAGGFELLCCEDVPEKYTREMRTAGAPIVLLCDAADMGVDPGQVRLVNSDQLGDMVISTHNCSLQLLATMLVEMGGKDVYLLGIQPVSTGFGQPLSEAVKAGIARFLGIDPANAGICRNSPVD